MRVGTAPKTYDDLKSSLFRFPAMLHTKGRPCCWRFSSSSTKQFLTKVSSHVAYKKSSLELRQEVIQATPLHAIDDRYCVVAQR